LLDKVVDIAKRYNSKKLMVEVRSKNNSAIEFYLKNGFNRISERNNYYKNPSDDALIFERRI
ncbi:MAG: GNAT family N-acetyltransferase, partial [Lachnospiraceae bacterium]|nr:GNAT family N-acetyltransferase [Lachnospiraceae bacterium]